MQDPILYVGKVENVFDQFIYDYGDYLFMVFAWICLFVIAWILFRKRKAPSREPASAMIQTIVEIIVTSPAVSSDAGRSPTRLTMGGDPSLK